MTVDDKTRDEELQCEINKEALYSRISALSLR